MRNRILNVLAWASGLLLTGAVVYVAVSAPLAVGVPVAVLGWAALRR